MVFLRLILNYAAVFTMITYSSFHSVHARSPNIHTPLTNIIRIPYIQPAFSVQVYSSDKLARCIRQTHHALLHCSIFCSLFFSLSLLQLVIGIHREAHTDVGPSS